LSPPESWINEGGEVYDFWDVRIITVHGRLEKEAKKETTGRF